VGYLTRLLDMAAGTPDAADDYWYEPRGTLAGSGVNVTADVALTVSAVFACVRVLAETVGSLPLVVYRRDGEDRKTRARGQRIYEILHDQPNGWMSSLEWREMMTGHCALRGNAYSWIQDGVRGAVDELIPLHPDRMEVEQLRSRRLRYHYTWPWGERQTFVQDEIYHLRGLSSDGITGLSVVSYARETIGLALASEGYAARMFLNDARPGGVLEHPGELSDGAHKRILASWQEDHGGWRNRGKPAIFEEGMKWHQIGMTGEDSQYILSRQFSVTEVARWFRMPPHLIQELTRSTFSNIEHQGLEFVIYTMMPWFRRWEQAIGRDLITSPDLFAEFLVDALLRGDTLSRYQAYGRGILDGWLTRNEARIKENLEPLPGLDTPLVPLNMGPAGTARWTWRSRPRSGSSGRRARRSRRRRSTSARIWPAGPAGRRSSTASTPASWPRRWPSRRRRRRSTPSAARSGSPATASRASTSRTSAPSWWASRRSPWSSRPPPDRLGAPCHRRVTSAAAVQPHERTAAP